ncbi:MAG TPA: HAMP domain-containing sensor histidine kinase [Solirubrobacterales bacterium]|nr:HAMP domain-containing sensor histidine kinase [Solirubrobacterales bacterium]
MRSLVGRVRFGQLTREAIRAALLATAVVAALYAVVGAITYVIVSERLTAAVDNRLNVTLAFVERRHTFNPGQPLVGVGTLAPARGERFSPPIAIWEVVSGGSLLTGYQGVELPAAYRGVTSPTTVTVGGEQIRLAGAQVGSSNIVAGETMSTVSQAQTNLVLAELAVLPPLLLAVFLGAYAIGRRVAAPIELARKRTVELTADASHELRTPLAVIEAEASLALTRPRTAASYRQAFTRVEAETQRMRRLVDDLIWLARLDAQPAAEAATGPVDLGVLASQAAERFRGVAESRGQSLEVEVPAALAIEAPAEWIDRLLGVLLDNACRYAPTEARIRVRVEEDGSRARVAVDDSGPGIPVAERTRIFDRFHRAGGEPGGAGLGLAIADAVVRATGGRWEVGESMLGGASMGVHWPKA